MPKYSCLFLPHDAIRRFLVRSRSLQYLVSGVFFTVAGPSLFWTLYPMGPMTAALVTEISCHSLRYLSFRYLVYPAQKGFAVTIPRYLGSIMPTSLLGLAAVALLAQHLDRFQLTMGLLIFSVSTGMIVNSLIYSKSLKFDLAIIKSIRSRLKMARRA